MDLKHVHYGDDDDKHAGDQKSSSRDTSDAVPVSAVQMPESHKDARKYIANISAWCLKIIEDCTEYLHQSPNTPRAPAFMPTRDQLCQLWLDLVTHSSLLQYANLEADRTNTLDMLWVVMAYVDACLDPVGLQSLKPASMDLQRLSERVRALDLQWAKTADLQAVETLHREAAAYTVYVYSQGIDSITKSLSVYYISVQKRQQMAVQAEFDADTKSSSSVPLSGATAPGDSKSHTGPGSEAWNHKLEQFGLIESEKDRALRRVMAQADDETRREGEILTLASNFVAYCQRTFMNIWIENQLVVYANENIRQEDVVTEAHLKRFHDWSRAEMSRDMSTGGLPRLFQHLYHRSKTPTGALIFSRRSRTSTTDSAPALTLLQTEMGLENRKTFDALVARASIPVDQILLQGREPEFLPLLEFALLCYMFEQTLGSVRLPPPVVHFSCTPQDPKASNIFTHHFLILRDQWVERFEWLHETKCLGRVKTPVVVQITHKWLVFHREKFYVCPTAVHAFLTWMRVVHLDVNHRGLLCDGTSIKPLHDILFGN